ncbi:hypothetical protein [Bacillus taeanensis]|uniref:Uncharacterized protein n=1 Tax=Bacillus taeanensis TaxID=273032 RepID=A0A366XSP7_9BACI|nr:hypothetical protein [Bacillus taeanensis]RBW68175.1 hypothetical protein DS031_18340 [Bacillus taeanensis]
MLQRVMVCMLLFGVLFVMKLPLFRGNRVDASYGALIMAVGIFFIGATTRFSFSMELPAYVVDFLLVMTWALLVAAFMQAAFKGVFRRRYLTHPVQSFAVGTWVAGTSILCLVLVKQFPVYKEVISLISLLNGGLWLFYFILCLKCYKVIIESKYYERIHGVLFLSTVSKQSLVILYSTLFENQILQAVSRGMLYLGIIFYVLNFFLMIKRYCFFRGWSVSEDWKNTNCIVHGAMSITGIASIMSGVFSTHVIFFIWVWVIVWFVIIEGIEVWRLVTRLKNYSLQKAAGTYHVSQWARNFTFGTFYVFTLNIDLSKTVYGPEPLFLFIQQLVIEGGLAVLVCLLVIESSLFFKDTLPWRESRLLLTPILKRSLPFQ